MKILDINFINLSKTLNDPCYATGGSDGLDLMACFDSVTKPKVYTKYNIETVRNDINVNDVLTLAPGERAIIPTGIKIQLPKGYEAQVRPRSGLALKYGITVLNTPGCIDSDYRGEIGVVLINTTKNFFDIYHGNKIAQLSIKESIKAILNKVDVLDETSRGEGGFGHTGK